jgi:Fe(3+) dicitrate transport protein
MLLTGLLLTSPVFAVDPQAETPSPVVGPTAQDIPDKPIKVPLTEIIGTSPNALEHIPGSGRVITSESIEKNRRLSINEALREVPGVHVRDEEGLGIRPNIGVRGLNPNRSAKLLILEDGVPITMNPYADPETYYFPPLFRFDRIEFLKGSGQLLHGPQSIGGVMNMITRMPPTTPTGHVEIRGGNNNYANTHFDYGGTWGKNGYLLDVTHFQSDTPRFTNQRAKVDDVTFKTVQELSDRTSVLAKFNYYREDSRISYQGLTESQYGTNPHFSPFENDRFDLRRIGMHVAAQHAFNANLSVVTNFFGHYINRRWKRQSTDLDGDPTTANATFNTGNPLAATVTQAIPTNTSFINDRSYWVYGVEPRFHLLHHLLGLKNEADFGARVLYENADRKQFRNGTTGLGESCQGGGGLGSTPQACLGENTYRTTTAYSLFLQNRFFVTDQITVTPGFRVEHINYDQIDRTANIGAGTFTKSHLTEVLPGIGATYSPITNYTFFTGVHRGFSPPKISDAVQSNVVTDLEAELSWNYELGVRGTPTPWSWFEVTGFRMDFQNQIISQTLSGGSGATNTNAGRTAHTGIEVATKLDLLDMVKGVDKNEDVIVDLNWTWLPQAEFRGTRNSSITGSALLAGEAATVSVNNNRLTFAPRNLLTAGIEYANNRTGFDGRLETQCISDQFSDDRNTYIPTPNGQRGVIKGWCVLNASVNQYVKPLDTTFYMTGKNLFDQIYMVDRARGIYPGIPLLVQFGARWTFN